METLKHIDALRYSSKEKIHSAQSLPEPVKCTTKNSWPSVISSYIAAFFLKVKDTMLLSTFCNPEVCDVK